jgi:hypothetical protein
VRAIVHISLILTEDGLMELARTVFVKDVKNAGALIPAMVILVIMAVVG